MQDTRGKAKSKEIDLTPKRRRIVSVSAKIAVSPKQREEIEKFCRRNEIRRLALFGSVLRQDFTSDSDIDVLVEFEKGKSVGLRFFEMERELSEILGRKVDLNTPGFLSPYFREEVLRNAEVLYDAA